MAKSDNREPNKRNGKPSKGKRNGKRYQPRKDSGVKRVNFDNTRESKFERDISDMKHEHDNDISWYAKNPELMRAAGSIGFAYTAGAPTGFQTQYSIPGIMVLGLEPSFGGSQITAVNQASDSQYSFTVHANSRNTSYSAKDQMVLVLAGANVYSFLSFVIRAYGVVKNYEQVNKYTPKAIITAMGLDFDDLESNLANMWFDINNMIAQSAQIWIPNTMPVITRWFWLYSSLYTDANSKKSQIYMFVPHCFLKYDDTSFETGSALVPATIQRQVNADVTNYLTFSPYEAGRNINNYKYTWQDLKDVFKNMISALVNSTDRGIIFGDILKAYGADKIYGMQEIPADYKVSPVYNPEVLTQIENATFNTSISPHYQIGLWQNMNTNQLEAIYYGASAASNAIAWLGKSALNFHQPEQPTPEQIMIATRLHTNTWDRRNVMKTSIDVATGKWSTPEVLSGVAVPYCTGTELVVGAYTYQYSGAMTLSTSSFTSIASQGSYTDNIRVASPFDWAPLVYPCQTGNNVTYEIMTGGVYGDIDNMCVVGTEDIYKLHSCAIYSEFDVPSM